MPFENIIFATSGSTSSLKRASSDSKVKFLSTPFPKSITPPLKFPNVSESVSFLPIFAEILSKTAFVKTFLSFSEITTTSPSSAADAIMLPTSAVYSSFGSAMLAGVAAGVFESAESAVKKCNKEIRKTVPDFKNTEKYRALFKKYKAIQKALEPIYNGEYI